MGIAGILVFLCSVLLVTPVPAAASEDLAVIMPGQPALQLPTAGPSLNAGMSLPSNVLPGVQPGNSVLEQGLVRWISQDISPRTGMLLSFQVLPEEKKDIYSVMGPADAVPAVIERTIVENGLIIYDGAVGQIALTLAGGDAGQEQARKLLEVYWEGRLGSLTNIRAGYPNNNFVYDPAHPDLVSSDLNRQGERGFIFRIINANGDYLSADPLDGKTRMEGFPTWPDIHWEDWKPVAGENAWVVIAAMQLYHHKKLTPSDNSVELDLSRELARAALLLQADNGGIRMAPLGTYRENEPVSPEGVGSWWYNQISTEKNLSWYSALRMLYQQTGDVQYKNAMDKMRVFFERVFDREGRFFYQGMSFSGNEWRPNSSDFAVDVQTWGILSLGPATIDAWFGEGAAYALWQKAREVSGTVDDRGHLTGVGYTEEKGRISVEWSAGAIMAARALAVYYRETHPDWSSRAARDADDMRRGMETFRRDLPNGKTAYAYSSKRAWIPFGWNSHDPRVMSLASSGWILFVDRGFNPFWLDGNAGHVSW